MCLSYACRTLPAAASVRNSVAICLRVWAGMVLSLARWFFLKLHQLDAIAEGIRRERALDARNALGVVPDLEARRAQGRGEVRRLGKLGEPQDFAVEAPRRGLAAGGQGHLHVTASVDLH